MADHVEAAPAEGGAPEAAAPDTAPVETADTEQKAAETTAAEAQPDAQQAQATQEEAAPEPQVVQVMSEPPKRVLLLNLTFTSDRAAHDAETVMLAWQLYAVDAAMVSSLRKTKADTETQTDQGDGEREREMEGCRGGDRDEDRRRLGDRPHQDRD